jgi:hypothetical protein
MHILILCIRLQAIATPLVPNMEKVQIIPPPKEVDPSVLVWKGSAVLGKMEGVSELWVTKADWVCPFIGQSPLPHTHSPSLSQRTSWGCVV